MDNLRIFELSIWTLQDSFITVLEDSYNKIKGKTQDATMTLNIDGTQELTFTIPMKIDIGGQFIVNPAWASVLNGNILINTRKVKVILNKNSEDEEIYEFVIDKVTERHESDQLYCDITCSGLAFYELGKIGYKIYLSSEDFYADDLSWFNKEKDEYGNLLFSKQPLANIQYWLNKFLLPLQDQDNLENNTFENFKWYYALQMDWDHHFNYPGHGRDKHKIYENTLKWDIEETAHADKSKTGDYIYTSDKITYEEKARMIDLEESNIYNLTQDIAEVFEVFCKYKYIYDENYHIIGRVVIFYNSFLLDNNQLSITYRNQTDSITREIDSTDIVTKMYVKTVDEEDELISIIDVEENPTGEDYILNFDYLYSIGSISEGQYEYIPTFSQKLKILNKEIKPLNEKIADIENKLIDVRAAIATAEDAILLDKEQMGFVDEEINHLTDNTGTISVTDSHPEFAVLIPEDNTSTYSINITTKGILTETIELFFTLNIYAKGDKLTDKIENFTCEFDENGNLSRLTNIIKPSDRSSNRVYLTYKYEPLLYYKNIKNTWARRLNKDEKDKNDNQAKLDDLQNKLNIAKIEQKKKLEEKNILLKDFEEIMGPAIREGYWQPENYSDSGDTYISNFYLKNPTDGEPFEKGKSSYDYFMWDTDLIEGEQDIYYELGVEQEKNYYKCIDLSDIWNTIKSDIENYSFLYYDYTEEGDLIHEISRIKNFSFKSQAKVLFVIKGNKISPVLLLIGGEDFSDATWAIIKDNCWVGKYNPSFNEETGRIDYQIEEQYRISSSSWITLDDTYKSCYPRIFIESLALKNAEDQLALTIGSTQLFNIQDYYITTKIIPSNLQASSSDESPDISVYTITLKNNSILKYITFTRGEAYFVDRLSIFFTLSNADTAIYNDALTISKESAFPQVSYEINYDIFTNSCLKVPSKYLNHIVKINDYELYFEDIQGYISGLTLDLDHPWQDTLEIKNYRTKFEDLFAKILAQTEAMQKNENLIENVGRIFDSNGNIQSDAVQKTLLNKDLNFAFNNGNLTIDEQNGIWGTSNTGVVAFRGGGIFTATEKDENGNWSWNTGITPEGLNAKLITAGQLDTNRVKIYAGDNLRLQLNENGLFAYKSFFEDFDKIYGASFNPTTRSEVIDKINYDKKESDENDYSNVDTSIDAAQYVRFNENGLFLVAEKDAYVLNSNQTNYQKLEDKVDRVSISWDGLTLRNYKNEKTFYANADTGDLVITGRITSSEGKIGPWYIADEAIYKSDEEKTELNFDDPETIYFGDKGLNFYNIFKIKIEDNGLSEITANDSSTGDNYLFKISKNIGDNFYSFNIGQVSFNGATFKQIQGFGAGSSRILVDTTSTSQQDYKNGDLIINYEREANGGEIKTALSRDEDISKVFKKEEASDQQKNLTVGNILYNYCNISYNDTDSDDDILFGRYGDLNYGCYNYFNSNDFNDGEDGLGISFYISNVYMQYKIIIAVSDLKDPKQINLIYTSPYYSTAIAETGEADLDETTYYKQEIELPSKNFISKLENGFFVFIVPNTSISEYCKIKDIEGYEISKDYIVTKITFSTYLNGRIYTLIEKEDPSGLDYKDAMVIDVEPPIDELPETPI